MPLRTVQRVLHLALGPEYARYRFREESGDVDQPIFGSCSWRRVDGTTALMVMVQPPWILTSADMKAVWRHSEVGMLQFRTEEERTYVLWHSLVALWR